MKRARLINELQLLLSDEYDANDLVALSKDALIEKIIDVAHYYKE